MSASTQEELGVCGCGVGCGCDGAHGSACTCNSADVKAQADAAREKTGCTCGSGCVVLTLSTFVYQDASAVRRNAPLPSMSAHAAVAANAPPEAASVEQQLVALTTTSLVP
ncbi:hypothetical protein DFJ77DRAFT_439437 [Powellomyces hirtus]|nr:hypothetical protein DFJ77DRAFT_439437 [Powellomyces hirtus]